MCYMQVRKMWRCNLVAENYIYSDWWYSRSRDPITVQWRSSVGTSVSGLGIPHICV
jgi:hypothetical protein